MHFLHDDNDLEGQPGTTVVLPVSPPLSAILYLVFNHFVCLAQNQSHSWGKYEVERCKEEVACIAGRICVVYGLNGLVKTPAV